ncbi:MAG: DUF362 domain-containing protein [Planctomycetota bacterium]|jgi:uncharacterized Fe-S center protein|nr:DUF362 domain-containing protein [Planctomycetota bacterium]
MRKAKVYFTNMRVNEEENLPAKLDRLLRIAGIANLDLARKFVAIKIHFGERGNLAFLRPNYAKTVVDLVRELGGKPFLTDSNTLYAGHRKDALEHLDTAYLNGFSPFSTGCHIIIADGLKGTDEVPVPVPGGKLVKTAKIGRGVMDADVVISLNHFKGHELTGFGGSLKNIGMGSGSRAGKMEMHAEGRLRIDAELCLGCRKCLSACAQSAISCRNGKSSIDPDRCLGCGRCLPLCPVDAIDPIESSSNENLNRKISEYAAAVLTGRPHFHVTLAIDITPFCDCHAENDVPIVPDVGMFASEDPVALDVACADAVNSQPACPGSRLDSNRDLDGDYFRRVSPETDWRIGVEHAVMLGLGSSEYDLVKI